MLAVFLPGILFGLGIQKLFITAHLLIFLPAKNAIMYYLSWSALTANAFFYILNLRNFVIEHASEAEPSKANLFFQLCASSLSTIFVSSIYALVIIRLRMFYALLSREFLIIASITVIAFLSQLLKLVFAFFFFGPLINTDFTSPFPPTETRKVFQSANAISGIFEAGILVGTSVLFLCNIAQVLLNLRPKKLLYELLAEQQAHDYILLILTKGFVFITFFLSMIDIRSPSLFLIQVMVLPLSQSYAIHLFVVSTFKSAPKILKEFSTLQQSSDYSESLGTIQNDAIFSAKPISTYQPSLSDRSSPRKSSPV